MLAFKPSVIRMNSHMLPQCTFPTVSFRTNMTLKVPLPGMRQHMLFNLVCRVKHFATLGALVPFLHQVVSSLMSCKILVVFESFVARRTFGLGRGQTMFLNHVSAFRYDTDESLIAEVAFVPLVHAAMDSFFVLFQFEVVVEHSLARFALEESVGVSADVNIQASLVHEPASALLAEEVPKMTVHVKLQCLEIVEFHLANRASRFLGVEFERNHVVFDMRVYVLRMLFSQMLHNLIEVVDVALAEFAPQASYIHSQDKLSHASPYEYFSILVVL